MIIRDPHLQVTWVIFVATCTLLISPPPPPHTHTQSHVLLHLPAPAFALLCHAHTQAANGMGAEDAQMVVEGMAQAGVEPTYCMGDDIPLAVLSDKPHMIYNYFKQRFAQVCVCVCVC
jgi:Glutamate synthase central domain